VSPRFVFAGYDDDLQGPFVRPHLDADGKLYGRFAALLIEAPEGLVLVDAGLGTFAGDLDAGHLHEELNTLGVRPWDVRVVVITHGHADHVGGLLGPRKEPAFPDARHVMHRREADFWASDAAADCRTTPANPPSRAPPCCRPSARHDRRGHRHRAEGPRHAARPATSRSWWVTLLWAGDAVSPLNASHPEWVSAADMDAAGSGRRRAFERAVREDLVLAASHLPIVGAIARAGNAYEIADS
jgi:glyoxylase-like metal-dependent hydrolase (beta-lactamase superfamily II)